MMQERSLIIHSQSAEKMLEEGSNSVFRSQFEKHIKLIKLVRERTGTVELAENEDPRGVGDYFQPGESVLVYGLWGGEDSCVSEAVRNLCGKNVRWHYGPEPFSILPYYVWSKY